MKKGFTLAEVLIVIGIIGMIANMTIPTLVQNVQEKTTVALLKKAYSTLSQAYTMTASENGTPDTWNLTLNDAGAATMMNMFKPYLRTNKDCGPNGDCFPNVSYNHFNNWGYWGNFNTTTAVYKVQLADGILLGSIITDPSCVSDYGSSQSLHNVCGGFYVDVNGFKNPNVVGKDMFFIYLTKSGMVPVGTQSETMWPFSGRGCEDVSAATGWGCTAWIIYSENMEYTKCKDLAWGGKTKC